MLTFHGPLHQRVTSNPLKCWESQLQLQSALQWWSYHCMNSLGNGGPFGSKPRKPSWESGPKRIEGIVGEARVSRIDAGVDDSDHHAITSIVSSSSLGPNASRPSKPKISRVYVVINLAPLSFSANFTPRADSSFLACVSFGYIEGFKFQIAEFANQIQIAQNHRPLIVDIRLARFHFNQT